MKGPRAIITVVQQFAVYLLKRVSLQKIQFAHNDTYLPRCILQSFICAIKHKTIVSNAQRSKLTAVLTTSYVQIK